MSGPRCWMKNVSTICFAGLPLEAYRGIATYAAEHGSVFGETVMQQSEGEIARLEVHVQPGRVVGAISLLKSVFERFGLRIPSNPEEPQRQAEATIQIPVRWVIRLKNLTQAEHDAIRRVLLENHNYFSETRSHPDDVNSTFTLEVITHRNDHHRRTLALLSQTADAVTHLEIENPQPENVRRLTATEVEAARRSLTSLPFRDQFEINIRVDIGEVDRAFRQLNEGLERVGQLLGGRDVELCRQRQEIEQRVRRLHGAIAEGFVMGQSEAGRARAERLTQQQVDALRHQVTTEESPAEDAIAGGDEGGAGGEGEPPGGWRIDGITYHSPIIAGGGGGGSGEARVAMPRVQNPFYAWRNNAASRATRSCASCDYFMKRYRVGEPDICNAFHTVSEDVYAATDCQDWG